MAELRHSQFGPNENTCRRSPRGGRSTRLDRGWCRRSAVPTDEELAEIYKAFDVRITYDKNRQVLDFAATITSELVPNENDRPEGRSQVSDIAGAGFEPATFGL
jgi:hypothetical protein